MTREQFHARWTDELLGMAVRTLISGEDVARSMFIRNRMDKVKDLLDRIYNDLRGTNEGQRAAESDRAASANAVRPGSPAAVNAVAQRDAAGAGPQKQPVSPANGQKVTAPTGPNPTTRGQTGQAPR